MKNGWQAKELAAVSAINYGYTESARSEPVGPQFLRITDIQNDRVDWESVPYCKIENADLSKYRLASGDIVFARTGATTGKSFLVNDPPDAVFASYLIRLRLLDKNLLPQFVSFFFQTPDYWQAIKDGSSGSAQGGFNATKLGAMRIPVPPLAEQERIVGLLDEAFAGIATAKANAERNLKNARGIFESHLQSVFNRRGKGWVDTKLDDVCGFQNGFAFKSNTFKASGIPVLRISNIQDGCIDIDNRLVFFNPKDYHENLDRYRIVKDDLLIAMSGATTGKLGFNTEDTVFYLNQRVGKFEPGKKLNRRFLYHFLSTKVEENLRISAGAAQPNLSTEQIKSFVLPLPDIAEQARIVEALESLSEETQRLASIYEQKIVALEALKKSLLHQAFNGVL
jgi:type I restriction enzyme S subunit